MGFKLIEKGKLSCPLNFLEVRIGNKGIGFGKGLRKLFKGYYGCEIYIDEENQLIKFKPSKLKSKAYSLGKNKAKLYLLNTKIVSICKFKGSYITKIKNKEIIIKVKLNEGQ